MLQSMGWQRVGHDLASEQQQIPTDARCYLTVVSICISQMISDFAHLFVCLVAICMFYLGKNVHSAPLPIFKSGCCVAVELYEFLSILHLNLSLDISSASIFSHLAGYIFTLLRFGLFVCFLCFVIFFAVQKVFSVM